MRDISTKKQPFIQLLPACSPHGRWCVPRDGSLQRQSVRSWSVCGACQLIHQHREQHHVAHHVAVRELGGCGSHAKCHTGLRQQGDAEVLLDSITAAGPRSAKGKNEKGKRSAARKNAYTSSILSAQTKSNRNMEPRQRAPVGQIKETPSVIAARCHPFPFWHFRATSPGRGSLSHGGRLWREGEVFHSAKGSLFEGAGTA